jgi:undecaprenyl-diphosphatase
MNDRMLYVLLLVALTFSFLAGFYEQFPGDVSIIQWMQTWHHTATTAFMEAASLAGSAWPVFALAGVVTLGLFIMRRRREGLVAAGAVAIMALNPLLKLLINRPRPPADLVGMAEPLGGFGFPSGHAFQSLIIFGLLIYMASVHVSRMWLQRFVQILMAALILAIGISRVYLGTHWPSDVLGAYLLGGFFLALLVRGYKTKAVVAKPQ